jgi:hypothetical protein
MRIAQPGAEPLHQRQRTATSFAGPRSGWAWQPRR